MAKKVFVKTLGCQMNVYDSKRMTDILKTLGYEETDDAAKASIILLNTCHIREKASEKIYSELGRYRELRDQKRKNGEQMLFIVAGCVVQAAGEDFFKRVPFVDAALGPQTYHRLPEILEKLSRTEGKKRYIEADFPAEPKFDFLPEASATGVSAFLAIQEGCDRFCSYCVVPYTRGAEYSRPMKEILCEAEQLARTGAKELTLLGQNVNAWHGDDAAGNPSDLSRLICALAKIDGIERLRYVTSYPSDFTDDMIAMHRDIPQVMPYLHLPVQSGSDSVLKRMNRRYTSAQYLTLIDKLRAARPDIALSSDFIVGFPNETDAEFEDTMKLVDAVGFASSYSFKFSARPGTPAAAMKNDVTDAVAQERLERLQARLLEQHAAFNADFVGKTVSVLFETKADRDDGVLLGHTPHMQNVRARADDSLVGQTANVKITHASAVALDGEVLAK